MTSPVLRSHQVKSLGDRVKLRKGLVWKGDRAFNARGTVTGSLQDPKMREIGLLVTQHCPPRNDMCELEAIYNFTTGNLGPDGRPNIRYTGDIAGRDTFQSAYRTMQYGGGDCDDHSVLNVVLAMVNGYASRFRITSNTGATWDHIYAMAGIPKHRPKRWIALDTTLGPGKFGREPPQAKHKDFLVGGVG